MTRPRTILHLSDLHFSSSGGHYWNSPSESHELLAGLPVHDRRGLVGSLVLDLERQGIVPDLICISGDIIDKANNGGIELAVNFIRGLCEQLRLAHSRVILVPGNHDVQRNVSPIEEYRLFANIWNQFYGNDRAAFEPSLPPHQHVYHLIFEDLGIEVVTFNSCEALAEGQVHGSIGSAQRDQAERRLRTTANTGLFRIAVMHHHLEKPPSAESRVRPDSSEIYDAALVREWMAGQRFRLVLHGHQHIVYHHNGIFENGHLAIVAGGSGGVADYGRKPWNLPLYYQIIQLNDNKNGFLVRRQYLPDKLEWGPTLRSAIPLQFAPQNEESTYPASRPHSTALTTPAPLAAQAPRVPPPKSAFDPRWYLERPTEESRARAAWATAGAPVVLKAPELFGKTWILMSLLEELRRHGHVVYISLKTIEQESVVEFRDFLRELGRLILEKCDLPEDLLEKAWKRPGSYVSNMYWLLSSQILPRYSGEKWLVLALDGIDTLASQSYFDRFLTFLRGIAEMASLSPWGHIRILITLSSIMSLRGLDIHRSPLENIAHIIPIGDLSALQIKKLAIWYRDRDPEETTQLLLRTVGGHPYLVHLVLHESYHSDLSVKHILTNKTRVFDPFLQMCRHRLQEQPTLHDTLRGIIRATSNAIDAQKITRLVDAGFLIDEDGPDGNRIIRLRYAIYNRLV